MRVAVLGLGSAGRRHARLAAELGHEPVGYDPADDGVSGVRCAASQAEAIASADSVIVASPNTRHAEQALAAIGAGRPVLVEKPLATVSSDAARVVAAARTRGVTCGVAMNLRFTPAMIELKRLIDEDAIGSVRYARASFGYDLRRWRPGADYRESYSARADLGGGIVLDAIHEIDYLLWMLGPVRSVVAETDRVSDLEIDVEDTAIACLRFESGALATLDLNFHEPAYRRECLLVGVEGQAAWSHAREDVEIRSADGEPRRIAAPSDPEAAYRSELVDFFEAAASSRPPRTPAEDGAEAVHVAEAIKNSAAGGRRVELSPQPRPDRA